MEQESQVKTKGQQTQDRILDAATELFAKHGFGETSVQMIADAVDLSQSAIFQHYKNKALILSAVRARISASNHTFVDSQMLMTDTADEALEKHCVLNVRWALLNRDLAQIIVLNYYMGMYDPEYRKISKGIVDLGRDRILKYIYAGIREGVYPKAVKPELLAEIIHEHLMGCFIRALASGDGKADLKIIPEKIRLLTQGLLL